MILINKYKLKNGVYKRIRKLLDVMQDVMHDPPTITLKKEAAVYILAFFAILVFPISPVLAVEPFCSEPDCLTPSVVWCNDIDDNVPTAEKDLEYDRVDGNFVMASRQGIHIPTYPQAVLVDSQVIRGEKLPKYQEEWSTSDSVPQVMSWYVEALKRDGWSIEQVPADPTAPMTQLVSAKKDDIILYVSVIRNQNESLTRIAIEYYNSELLEEDDEADETVTDIPQ